MKRIYLAAPFEQIDRMKAYAEQLRALGFEVTSRWLDEQDKGGDTDLTDEDGGTQLDKTEMAIAFAVRDIRNILVADTVIEFNPGKALVRNTRLAEFGGALFLGKQCIVVGPEKPQHKNRIDTVFCLLGEGSIPEDLAQAGIKPVKHYDSWGDFLEFAIMEKPSKPIQLIQPKPVRLHHIPDKDWFALTFDERQRLIVEDQERASVGERPKGWMLKRPVK